MRRILNTVAKPERVKAVFAISALYAVIAVDLPAQNFTTLHVSDHPAPPLSVPAHTSQNSQHNFPGRSLWSTRHDLAANSWVGQPAPRRLIGALFFNNLVVGTPSYPRSRFGLHQVLDFGLATARNVPWSVTHAWSKPNDSSIPRAPLQAADYWQGGVGNWSNGMLWSTHAVPGAGNDVYITAPTGQVELDVTDTINNLTVGSGSALTFANGVSLTIGGTAVGNSGTITLSGNGTLAIAGNVMLSGGGFLALSNTDSITGSAAGNTLTNYNTIEGSGNIGLGSMSLVNSGTINANQPVPLVVETSIDGLTNNAGGTMEAANGGILILNATGTITNAGTIQATGGSSLQLNGGTYTNNGTIQNSAGNLQLQNATVNGNAITQIGTASMLLDGASVSGVTNSSTGTIRVSGSYPSSIGALSNPVWSGNSNRLPINRIALATTAYEARDNGTAKCPKSLTPSVLC